MDLIEKSVKVPVEAFHRRAKPPEPLDGKLVSPSKLPADSFGQAVLITVPPMVNQGTFHQTLNSLSKKLALAGFPVLILTTRNNGKKDIKAFVEDVQSGVTFFKSIRDTQIGKIILIGLDQTAAGALSYASASKQMAFILDGLLLINPTNIDDSKKLIGVPLKLMRLNSLKSIGDEKNSKQILAFVKKPHHE